MQTTLFLPVCTDAGTSTPSFYQTRSAEQATQDSAAIACSPVRMRSRRSDPTTSHAAAAKAARFAASHAGRVLFALRKYGPSTAHEIAYTSGLTVVQIDRRLPELADKGLAFVVLHMGEPVVRAGARVWSAL